MLIVIFGRSPLNHHCSVPGIFSKAMVCEVVCSQGILPRTMGVERFYLSIEYLGGVSY